MERLVLALCFYFPLVSKCLNFQGIITYLYSDTYGQLLAYSNLVLILAGLILFRSKFKKPARANILFVLFYLFYYGFGLLNYGIHGLDTSIIATLVPVFYFFGFYFLLSIESEFKMFFIVITTSFVISTFLTIILFKLNINLSTVSVYEWELDRASGIIGDANAAAHNCILAYILFNHAFRPQKLIFKIIKILVLITIFYGLTLTFSTTGLSVFAIVFILLNIKFFRGLRIALIMIIIPIFYMGLFSIKSDINNLNLSEAQTDKVNNIVNLLTLDFNKVDNSGRGELAKMGMYYIKKNPILGNGLDFSVKKRVHNTYLGVWVDGGVITFFVFILVLFNYFRESLKIEQVNEKVFSLSILAVLYIFMISLQSIINKGYLIVLFVFVGYIIHYNQITKNNLMELAD